MILALGLLLLLATVAVAATLRDAPTADAPAAPSDDDCDDTGDVAPTAPSPPEARTVVRIPLPVWEALPAHVRACLRAESPWVAWDGHLESALVPLESEARANLVTALVTARVSAWSELVLYDDVAVGVPRESTVRATGARTSDVGVAAGGPR